MCINCDALAAGLIDLVAADVCIDDEDGIPHVPDTEGAYFDR
ncbi:hypothetical protein ACFWYW_58940 [Nonomuraea sp. NPDC059023]